ncbi:MAG: hypothetical protein AMJ81_01225 [Phycisphaerae bacterium SM23_33]|nr:MAG: hypothetical protein AMJ81_01225 [Phycisphaerae bacterium SM23_33]
MADSRRESAGRSAVPPPQHNLEDAAAQALIRVCRQPPQQLEWLGARRASQHWVVPVLDDLLSVELDGGTVRTSAGRPTAAAWRILTLHYLAVAERPSPQAPAVSFADLPAGRAYAPVYRRRVIERLCRTVGRDGRALRAAAEALGGRAAPEGDAAFDFRVYPRVRLRLVWYGGDQELEPSAVLLLPANIESFFCPEDIVVLSERLVSRWGGGRF